MTSVYGDVVVEKADVHDSDKLWEYAVFVTNVANPLEFVGQFYSDRADAAGLQLVELVLHGRAPAGAA